ncbi:moulting cycle domain-containing protein [Ditylenchus destructor]|uniref:Moulting cycle domain-containing protein n=1 Tax=Ditylenchus destructor TaxID=166010 RepID=A0AAD4MR48_9BILA|nr:moulting cycle domain-containing protein [Ditylenchus destructor]
MKLIIRFRVLKAKPRHMIEEFGECNKRATGIPMQARCLSLLLKDQISGENHLKKNSSASAQSSLRLQKWQETIALMRERALRRKEAQKRLEEESLENMDQFIFRGMRDRRIVREDLATVLNDPSKLKHWLTEKSASKPREPAEKLIGLLRQGLKIGYSLSGKNSSNFDDKTLKIASPRFLSVVPDGEESKNETVELLSPSIFSMHDKGQGIEKLMSLPNLMKGLSGQDHQKWMDFIMEAAGVVDEVDKLETEMKDPKTTANLRKRYETESRSKDGTPLYFTRDNVTQMFGSFEDRKIEAYLSLANSLSKDQVKELNRTGYVMMTRKQLHLIYGPKSPYNNSKALARLSRFRNASHMEQHLIEDIHHAAQLRSFELRQKDVLMPISFMPVILNGTPVSEAIVLSPIIFSPLILSPSLLGPLILSPTIFTPVILAPRTFSPIILSPLAFVPFVLSPVTFHPLILSPGVFVPVILTPVTLSPFILSPQVFSPFVLSPLVLSPLILNPNVGSPLVLSPIIFSPQALGALILSPYALSPVIQSKLIAYNVVLSPSWLSK